MGQCFSSDEAPQGQRGAMTLRIKMLDRARANDVISEVQESAEGAFEAHVNDEDRIVTITAASLDHRKVAKALSRLKRHIVVERQDIIAPSIYIRFGGCLVGCLWIIE